MSNQAIRITLKAYDHRELDLSAQQILEAAERTGAAVAGPIPMPTSIRRFCVLRSPHVNKKSREHFELRIHKRIIDIVVFPHPISFRYHGRGNDFSFFF